MPNFASAWEEPNTDIKDNPLHMTTVPAYACAMAARTFAVR